MKGLITLGRNTSGHQAILTARGYETQVVDGVLQVECSGFHTDPFVLNKENLTALVAAKQLLTYRTPIKVGDKFLTSILACTQMEKLFAGSSALVARPQSSGAKASPAQLDW